MSNNVLVIAPHPDDEALGCGGTIAKHVADGDTVTVLFLSRGEKGVPGQEPGPTAEIRIRESDKAKEILGYQWAVWYSYPDSRLQENISAISNNIKVMLSHQFIDIVYAPNVEEAHIDHSAAAVASAIALAELPDIELRYYEVWTPQSRIMLKVDITKYIDIKRAAIRAYQSQDTRNSFSEAMLALNHYRGLLHGPNMMYAEVFNVI